MTAYRLVVAYRGGDFCGWQAQRNTRKPSIQAVLEQALSDMFQQELKVTGAGRTDAGVHSLGQTASFRVGADLAPENVQRGLNRLLPPAIRVLEAARAPLSFHPRYDAREKTYRYLVQQGTAADPLLSPYSVFVADRLDLERMGAAAARLEGRHDFAAFQGAGRPAARTVRTLYELRVGWAAAPLFAAGRLVCIRTRGEGYLYRMVRNIVGTLLEVGRGRLAPAEVTAILRSGDRRRAGPTAPPEGLTLVAVGYREPEWPPESGKPAP